MDKRASGDEVQGRLGAYVWGYRSASFCRCPLYELDVKRNSPRRIFFATKFKILKSDLIFHCNLKTTRTELPVTTSNQQDMLPSPVPERNSRTNVARGKRGIFSKMAVFARSCLPNEERRCLHK
ncbi:uncharacterized protein LOC142982970 [Anticarsia gemmatalis]|uniref:uncharacterized protein LOC142982970 n=1 Tax=Anticarsia gemmatalis TaxID=129554 RepID=UPI003F758AC4